MLNKLVTFIIIFTRESYEISFNSCVVLYTDSIRIMNFEIDSCNILISKLQFITELEVSRN